MSASLMGHRMVFCWGRHPLSSSVLQRNFSVAPKHVRQQLRLLPSNSLNLNQLTRSFHFCNKAKLHPSVNLVKQTLGQFARRNNPFQCEMWIFRRHYSRQERMAARQKRAQSQLWYLGSVVVVMLGMAYAGVPLYRIFCQATGIGGKPTVGHDDSKVESMYPVSDRLLTITFNADISSSMRWKFRPQQAEVQVSPGETALAFYTATNPTDKPVIGISTYNVLPYEAGAYFNKIQCFCFEEQRLNPHEQVDMPVFFYIDPEFDDDPALEHVRNITLSYTFFEAKDGLQLPLPGYLQPHNRERKSEEAAS